MSASDSSATWVIVPMRGIYEGKSRLDIALYAPARAALNRRLLVHTLTVVLRWSGAPHRCVVVSPCPETLAIARAAGASGVSEGQSAAGLNQAAALGAAYAAERGAKRSLILPADLPRLSVRALRDLEATHDICGGVVLATDKARLGTNALLLEPAHGFEFGFGSGSRARHVAAAKRCGLTIAILVHPELQFDLDTPEDLIAWTRGDARARAAMKRIGMAPGRISMRLGAGVNIRSDDEAVEEAR